MTQFQSQHSSKVLLVILDGFGISENSPKNAIKAAKTENLDYLFSHYPFTTIEASGEEVGLPKGVMGNSEVGHMNLGAGRPVRQDLVRINESIKNKEMEKLERFQELINTAKNKSKRIHLMGLLSDGGVHSHIDHLKEIMTLLGKHPDLEIFFHAFMDGRDTNPDSGEKYLKEIQEFNQSFTFASMQGRSIGMDRDRRWEKIELAYKTLTGKGEISSLDPLSYLKSQYGDKKFDEFIEPTLFDSNAAIQKEDCVFFINFRPDRAIQLTLAFTQEEFSHFERPIMPAYYLCMTPYVPDEVELPILFDKERIQGGLSEHLSKLSKKQFKIAETEKYAHVTFFFNGGLKTPYPGETQKLIPSPREVKTYNEKPQMSAYEVTESLTQALEQKGDSQFDFFLVNYANCDMVGHTGDYTAAIKAVETVDECIGKLYEVCQKENITMLITADHGNSDQMVHEDGSPHTAHTQAPVPFCLIHPKFKDQKINLRVEHPALMDVAPTVLTLMGIDYPPSFQGQSIFDVS